MGGKLKPDGVSTITQRPNTSWRILYRRRGRRDEKHLKTFEAARQWADQLHVELGIPPWQPDAQPAPAPALSSTPTDIPEIDRDKLAALTGEDLLCYSIEHLVRVVMTDPTLSVAERCRSVAQLGTAAKSHHDLRKLKRDVGKLAKQLEASSAD